jgi:hypothetical protein
MVGRKLTFATVAFGSRFAGCRRFPQFGARIGAAGHDPSLTVLK